MFIITIINGEIEWMSRNEDTLEEWSNDWFYRTIPEFPGVWNNWKNQRIQIWITCITPLSYRQTL